MAARPGHRDLARRRLREHQRLVLDEQVDREVLVEVALRDGAALERVVRRREAGGHDHVEDRLDGDARLLPHHQPLAEAFEHEGDHRVADELGHRALAHLSAVDGLRAHRHHHRQQLVVDLPRPAGHEEERALRGPVLGAGHGRLERIRPRARGALSARAGSCRDPRSSTRGSGSRASPRRGSRPPRTRAAPPRAGRPRRPPRRPRPRPARAASWRPAPRPRPGSRAFSGVRFQTVSGNPFFKRFWAMRLPMRPRPANPIRCRHS